MKTFSQPLSAEEEAYYIKALQSSDSRKAAEAREVLIERNLRLVAHIAKKYQNAEEDMEDLISIGTIGLIKAVSSFDAGKGKLSTYASRCIDNELLMLLRSKKKSSREVSLFEPIYHDGGEAIYVMDQVKDTKNVDENWLENIALSEAMKHLDEREKHILNLRFFQSRTQMEVAEEIGISQAQVSRLEKSALKQLRKYV